MDNLYSEDYENLDEKEAYESEEDESSRLFFCVDSQYKGVRLDSVLSELTNVSRAQVQKWIKQQLVLCDGQPESSPSRKLKGGEKLEVNRPPLLPAVPEPDPNVLLDIVYEDSDILVLNKGRGQVVHPGAGVRSGTLVNGLLAHCHDLSGIGGVERPGIVHRLDKDTSGLIVITKNDAAHLNLSAQFANRLVTKYYEALVYGVPKLKCGLIDQPIGRHPVSRQCMAVRANGRPSKTEYRTVEAFADKYAHLSIHLFTGRTHQIRVHMSWLGHPLLGDPLYKPKSNPWGLQGQALHCYYLSFAHPRTGEKMEFRASAPQVIQNILQDLRTQYPHSATSLAWFD